MDPYSVLVELAFKAKYVVRARPYSWMLGATELDRLFELLTAVKWFGRWRLASVAGFARR
jgi:hypothetical protein